MSSRRIVPLLLVMLLVLPSCARSEPTLLPSPLAASEETEADVRLDVAATTTIVGDVVAQIGREAIHLTVLLPPNADPHAFEPSPQDVAALAGADLVFINGAGLEEAMRPVLESAARPGAIVSLSESLDLRRFADEQAAEGDDRKDEHEPGDLDPHVWFDPENVIAWTEVIEATLAEADPAHAEQYAANAEGYRQELHQLDAWIAEQVQGIPPERRRLVTDHDSFGYFADRYGFEVIGAVVPGFSTLAEPSAWQIAELESAIRELGVPAVFVGTTVNPALAERIAEDTGIQVVPLYTGSLSEPEGPVGTYLDLMKYNTAHIVEALR